MNEETVIRVHYPPGCGEIRLRTDENWERDLLPVDGDPGAGRFDFRIRADAPFRYFKPLLVADGGTHWALGENRLAVRSGQAAMDVYPHFFSDGGCSACVLHRVASRYGAREHAARVFYPAGYHENPLERFPVVYMQDGQNLFFPNEAFAGHDWKIQETLNVLTAMNLIRRVIVVGIYPGDRMVDYTGPGYDDYTSFVVDELKPWVDANYRTLEGPGHTAAMGSSLGGVVSLHMAWSRPDVFGNAGCLSSTFGWRDDLFGRIARGPRRPIRVYLDSGWPGDNYEVTLNMRNLLLERGYRLGEELMHLAFPHATHDERSWAMRAHIPFQHFFRA